MIRVLLTAVLLRRLRATYPELFDGAAALLAIEQALREHEADEVLERVKEWHLT